MVAHWPTGEPALASQFPASGLELTALSLLPSFCDPHFLDLSLHCGCRDTGVPLSPGKCPHSGGNQLPPGLSSLLGDSGSPGPVLLGGVVAKATATSPEGQTSVRGH